MGGAKHISASQEKLIVGRVTEECTVKSVRLNVCQTKSCSTLQNALLNCVSQCQWVGHRILCVCEREREI